MYVIMYAAVTVYIDVAKVVFNRCAVANDDQVSKDNVNYQITFNYEFLEDFREIEHELLKRAFTRYNIYHELATSNRHVARRHNVSDAKSSVSNSDIEEKTGKKASDGFQTDWGPVGYTRTNHCLNVLVRLPVGLHCVYHMFHRLTLSQLTCWSIRW